MIPAKYHHYYPHFVRSAGFLQALKTSFGNINQGYASVIWVLGIFFGGFRLARFYLQNWHSSRCMLEIINFKSKFNLWSMKTILHPLILKFEATLSFKIKPNFFQPNTMLIHRNRKDIHLVVNSKVININRKLNKISESWVLVLTWIKVYPFWVLTH